MIPILVILAALAAAGAAYAFNRLTRRFAGRVAIVLVAPGLEESFKTGAALLLGAPVFFAHLAFGVLEGLYDLFAGARPERETARRAGAAVASLAGHALFGAITVAVGYALASWPLGVAAAYLAHVGWNGLVMGRVRRQP